MPHSGWTAEECGSLRAYERNIVDFVKYDYWNKEGFLEEIQVQLKNQSTHGSLCGTKCYQYLLRQLVVAIQEDSPWGIKLPEGVFL